LQARGIRVENQISKINTPFRHGDAHGASEKALQRARAGGFEVMEATCPLVHQAHPRWRLVRKDFTRSSSGSAGMSRCAG